MSHGFSTISPIDGSVVCERTYATAADLDGVLARSHAAQRGWRAVPLADRCDVLRKVVDAVIAAKDELGAELTAQMGRPIRYSAGELLGFRQRADYMIDVAPDALADIPAGEKPGFTRFVRREPLGVVLVLAPWNYPWLTSVNAVVPALLAGNSVVLKHADQTPLVAERYSEMFAAAGLPDGVFQHIHMTHDRCAEAIGDARVAHVCFTGSVVGGQAVSDAAARRFIGVGLELGGKDPAYVRADADLDFAVENLVDGAFFNSGQSCCGVERIYVHASLYDRFIAGFAKIAQTYVLGDPRDEATTIGPMVRVSNAEGVRKQIADAVAAGARKLVDTSAFPLDQAGSAYLGPQVLVDVDHSMEVMREETFGPVVGIMAVGSDEEAIALMNDSRYGLTASIWSQDSGAAMLLGDQLQTGTVFLNRCDYLDPALAWVGVKDSGRGATLSKIGFEHLTRPKSFHLRTSIT